MLPNSILFFALVLVALTAGRALWAWLGENPANLSGATYVEFFQALSRAVRTPSAENELHQDALSDKSFHRSLKSCMPWNRRSTLRHRSLATLLRIQAGT